MKRHVSVAAVLLTALLGAMVACERGDHAGSSSTAAPASAVPSAAAPSASGVSTVAHHYEIEGMHCEGCVAAIESKVKALPGVSSCSVNLETRRALVESASAADDAAIRAAVERLGYKIQPVP